MSQTLPDQRPQVHSRLATAVRVNYEPQYDFVQDRARIAGLADGTEVPFASGEPALFIGSHGTVLSVSRALVELLPSRLIDAGFKDAGVVLDAGVGGVRAYRRSDLS